jgi:hypothetical protein
MEGREEKGNGEKGNGREEKGKGTFPFFSLVK